MCSTDEKSVDQREPGSRQAGKGNRYLQCVLREIISILYIFKSAVKFFLVHGFACDFFYFSPNEFYFPTVHISKV